MLPSLIARRLVGRKTLLWPRFKAIHFNWLGPEHLVCSLANQGGPTIPDYGMEPNKNAQIVSSKYLMHSDSLSSIDLLR